MIEYCKCILSPPMFFTFLDHQTVTFELSMQISLVLHLTRDSIDGTSVNDWFVAAVGVG